MKDKGEIVLFQSEDGSVKLDVRLESETVWLTQQQIASLYGKAVSTVNEHIKDIFEDKELTPEACTKKFGNSEFQQKAHERSRRPPGHDADDDGSGCR